jgi:competence protein ComEC
MNSASGVILSLAYILGLLSTATAWGKLVLLVLGVGAAIILPKFWRTAPKLRIWLAAVIVGFLASLYLQVRMPHPAANDISKFIPTSDVRPQEQVVTVQGKVASVPRLTRSQRSQFWLQTTSFNEVQSSNDQPADSSQAVKGKLYVTVPLLQATGLHRGQAIAVTGVLYKPKPAANPGAFNFKAYLAREGGFAGMSGRQVSWLDEQQGRRWGWWAIRQRIVRSQVNWLGSPEGPLVSSIVLGNKAVELPYDITDQFIQVGLAHALAASGFQVSLILAVLLALTQRVSAKTQFILGTIALVIFVCLTGVQPSVMRAAVMGLGALVALVMQRKIKPLGSILAAASILLVLNPLWIWDLGFELSFLATLGLLVTVPPLTKQLDWCPPAIASLIAVPIAASLWTLPLQLYAFGLFAPYSVAANITSTPLIAAISIGGVISALMGLIWPLAGSALAWLLYYPTHWLIGLVQFFCWLPGNSVAIGKISGLQMIALYGLIGLVLLSRWWHRRWWVAGLVAVALVALPAWQTKMTIFRATVLATAEEQVLVIQDQSKVLLVNSGDVNTASFTVLPFLQQEGVNQIDWAIALDSDLRLRRGWFQVLKRLPIKTFYNPELPQTPSVDAQTLATAVKASQGVYQAMPVGTTIQLGSTPVKLISAEPALLQLQVGKQTWLLIGDLSPDEQKQVATSLPRVQVLHWSGGVLTPELLNVLQPAVAIASSSTVDPETLQNLYNSKIKLYWTGRDGAIQWTPTDDFEPTLETIDINASLL